MAYKDSKTPLEERDSFGTPDWLSNWLQDVYRFDIDLAASSSNAKHFYYLSIEDNALTTNWKSKNHLVGFCNPPYSKTKTSSLKDWIHKAIIEQRKGFKTLMLMPTPNGESYFKEAFCFASHIIFINGRVSFIDAHGQPKSGNNRGSCVIVFDNSTESTPKLLHVDRDFLINKYGDTNK